MTDWDLAEIINLIPNAWRFRGDARVIYSAYRCLSPESPALTGGWGIDLGRTIAMAGWSTCEYVDNLQKPKLDYENGCLTMTPVSGGSGRTDSQAHVVILQRVLPNEEFDDPKFEIVRRALCGLLSVNFSNAVTYSELFVNSIDTAKKEFGAVIGKLVVKSSLLFQPYFSDERATRAVKIYEGMLRSKKGEQRYLRALHWYDVGHRATDAVDAFINIWIAIEALVLDQQSNIFPLKKSMADAYGMSPADAGVCFGLGRIFNLRSSLFHGQDRPNIGISFIEYLEAIFADILHQELGLTCEGRARTFLCGKTFDQSDLAPAVQKRR